MAWVSKAYSKTTTSYHEEKNAKKAQDRNMAKLGFKRKDSLNDPSALSQGQNFEPYGTSSGSTNFFHKKLRMDTSHETNSPAPQEEIADMRNLFDSAVARAQRAEAALEELKAELQVVKEQAKRTEAHLLLLLTNETSKSPASRQKPRSVTTSPSHSPSPPPPPATSPPASPLLPRPLLTSAPSLPIFSFRPAIAVGANRPMPEERLSLSRKTLVSSKTAQATITPSPDEAAVKTANTATSKESPQTLQDKTRTYAEVAVQPATTRKKSKRTKQQWEAITAKMLNTAPTQTDYKKIHIRVNSIVFKRCKSNKDVTEILQGVLRTLGISRHIPLVSKIGNSLVELYVPVPQLTNILELLEGKAVLEENLDLESPPSYTKQNRAACNKSLINRLSHLYKCARFVKLKACVLDGFSQDIQDQVLSTVHNHGQHHEDQ